MFDEAESRAAQHVYAVELGPGAAPGTSDIADYNHYGLLADLYQTFNLGTAPNNASVANPLPFPA